MGQAAGGVLITKGASATRPATDLDALEEGDGLAPVDQAVVICERQVHDWPAAGKRLNGGGRVVRARCVLGQSGQAREAGSSKQGFEIRGLWGLWCL